jgi:hypothetical protein
MPERLIAEFHAPKRFALMCKTRLAQFASLA